MTTPAYRESIPDLKVGDETLHGVLAEPANGAQRRSSVAVLIVVGGPQYRAGAHRQFVLLARWLAAAGHAVMRLDVRGMGDSGGMPLGFEHQHEDIACGIDALMTQTGVERVVLWGLCDGASASLLYLDARADHRVAGLALLNPWVRSEQSLALTHVKHYYRARLLQPSFWGKLLRGGVGWHAWRELCSNALRALRRGPAVPARSYQQRMASAWKHFDGAILLMLSENDWTAREFEEYLHSASEWADARNRPRLQWHSVDGADHTLSQSSARMRVEQLTLDWLVQQVARRD